MRTLPTLRPGTKKPQLTEWLRRAFGRPGQTIDDIHFDELAGAWGDVHDGLEWIAHCCKALREVSHAVRTCDNLLGVRHSVVALPLDTSKHIRLWKPSYWRTAGVQTEPPCLILMKSDGFDDRHDEEYSRKLDLPIGDYSDITAVFRSQRELGKFNEFANVIFLVAAP